MHNKLTPSICLKCKWSGVTGDCNKTYCQPSCPKCSYTVVVCDVLKPEFVKELEQLINRHSMENDSNTPDFILAHYLAGCLRNFNEATRARHSYVCPPVPQQQNVAWNDAFPMSQSDLAK